MRLRGSDEHDLRTIVLTNEAAGGAFADLIDVALADPDLDLDVQVGPIDVTGARLDVLALRGDLILEHRQIVVGSTAHLEHGVLAGLLRLRVTTVLSGIERWRARRGRAPRLDT